MEAAKEGLDFVTCNIPSDLFNDESHAAKLPIFFSDLHAIFYLNKLDITIVTMRCM